MYPAIVIFLVDMLRKVREVFNENNKNRCLSHLCTLSTELRSWAFTQRWLQHLNSRAILRAAGQCLESMCACVHAIKAVSRERHTNSPDGPNDLAKVSWHTPLLFTFNSGPERAIHIPIIDLCQSNFSLNQKPSAKTICKGHCNKAACQKGSWVCLLSPWVENRSYWFTCGEMNFLKHEGVFMFLCKQTKPSTHSKVLVRNKGKEQNKEIKTTGTSQIFPPVEMCSDI